MKGGVYTGMRLNLHPNAAQRAFIDESLEKLRHVYNACLYHLKHTYLHQGGRVCSQFDLNRFCKVLWDRNPWLHGIYNNCMFETAARARQAFLRCIENARKEKRESGVRRFPRCRKTGEFNTFGYLSNKTFSVSDTLDNGKLKRYVRAGKMSGLLRARNLQRITGTPKTLRIHRRDYGTHSVYTCSLSIRLPDGYEEDEVHLEAALGFEERGPIGIDVGLTHVAVFSDGTCFDNPRAYAGELERFRRLHSEYSRSRGTPREAKVKSKLLHKYDRVRNIRNELRNEIVNAAVYDRELVAVEDLSLARMRRKARGRGMQRSYADASLRGLLTALHQKSQKTRCRVVAVDPAYTSQTCSECGRIVEKDLGVRIHVCPFCGYTADRDYNAARNILARGLAGNPSPA